MTVEQEALLFAEQNGFSAPLTAGIRQAVDQIKSLALWSKPNEVSPQTKKSNDFEREIVGFMVRVARIELTAS